MGYFSHLAAIETAKLADDGRKGFESIGKSVNRSVDTSIKRMRGEAANRLRSGHGGKKDAVMVLQWHAQRWAEAGRPDFELQYKAMAKAIKKGAPFTVSVDPVSQEVLISPQ